ncbi:MAG: FAD-binding oxidoreductase [Gammaproteobacteria bacterium]|nr:FAD-binding oxidoreductase [Gammaproteobacteria bacterium]
MALKREAYQELEAIVGADHISDKPHILAGNRQALPNMPRKPVSPEAIVMPASADEVARVVRACNRHGVRYIPIVSGLILFAYPVQPDTIIIHLKRMNHIEFLDEDRMVILEPGIRHVQLQPEALSRGLTYPAAAVGPGGTVLGNFACSAGDNHNQNGSSRANRSLLGIEWVTPEGEIVRLGSLATGSGWFCADGPGPSLRGLIRGFSGAMGSFGIVTRIAIALEPWSGPRVMPHEGRSPNYVIRLPQETHRAFIFKFPTLDAVRDAMLEIGKAEIGAALIKYFNCTAALLYTTSANEFHELWDSGLFQREMGMPLYVYLATHSAAEMAYQRRVLDDIVHEFGGEPVDPRIQRMCDDSMDFFVLLGSLQRVLRLGGAWAPDKLEADSVRHIFAAASRIKEYFPEMIARGLFFDAPDNWQIIPLEYGHVAHLEHLLLWERSHPQFAQIPGMLMARSFETDLKYGHHAKTIVSGGPLLDQLGPLYSNYHVWLNAIRAAFGAAPAGGPPPGAASRGRDPQPGVSVVRP